MLSSATTVRQWCGGMGATTDRDVRAGVRPGAARVAIVCTDPVARILALRSIERLGRPAPQLFATLAESLAAACDTLLIDDGDLPDDSAALLAAAAPRPYLIVMSAQDGVGRVAADARLRKPLTQQALAAALEAAAGTGAGRGFDTGFDRAIWDELLRLFGCSGIAEMIAALERDLPQQRQRLADALLAQDRGAIKRLAHSLRGVALQFGATQLAEDFGVLEHAAVTDESMESLGHAAAAMLDRQALLIQQLGRALNDA